MELHQVMTSNGLSGAANFMTDYFDVKTGQPKAKSTDMPQDNHCNRNDNCANRKHQAVKVDSEVTIYKNAIPQRVSTSSEEEMDIDNVICQDHSLRNTINDTNVDIKGNVYSKYKHGWQRESG